MARRDGQNSFAPAAAEPAGEARETSCASCRTKSLVARPRKGRLNEPLSSQQRSAQLRSSPVVAAQPSFESFVSELSEKGPC